MLRTFTQVLATSVFGLAILALLPTESARAEAIGCQARVALNRVYEANFDTTTGDIALRNDAGTTISGRGSVSVSGRTGNTILFLATAFNQGVEIEVEAEADGQIAMCLGESECYLCRR